MKMHNKKLDGLTSHKKEINRINENPNWITANLSSRTINNEEYKILTYGLNHGITVSVKQNDILASSDALWHQLERNKCLKENFRSIQRAKNAIHAMSFSLLEMKSKQFVKGKRNITILNNLLKYVVLLKPDKDNGMVLVDWLDHKSSIKQIFSDWTKFRKIIENQRIWPQNGRLATAHGLPKVLKRKISESSKLTQNTERICKSTKILTNRRYDKNRTLSIKKTFKWTF